ncbi:hypothetical protein NL676_035201 [Syzygium grande]|nr:hypothetical protein NL676_035201 [Syzygium grande]
MRPATSSMAHYRSLSTRKRSCTHVVIHKQQPIQRRRQPRWELLVRLPAPVVLEVEHVAHRVVPELRGRRRRRDLALPPLATPDPSDEASALVPDLWQRELWAVEQSHAQGGQSSLPAAAAVVAARGGGLVVSGGDAVVEAAEEEARGGRSELVIEQYFGCQQKERKKQEDKTEENRTSAIELDGIVELLERLVGGLAVVVLLLAVQLHDLAAADCGLERAVVAGEIGEIAANWSRGPRRRLGFVPASSARRAMGADLQAQSDTHLGSSPPENLGLLTSGEFGEYAHSMENQPGPRLVTFLSPKDLSRIDSHKRASLDKLAYRRETLDSLAGSSGRHSSGRQSKRLSSSRRVSLERNGNDGLGKSMCSAVKLEGGSGIPRRFPMLSGNFVIDVFANLSSVNGADFPIESGISLNN